MAKPEATGLTPFRSVIQALGAFALVAAVFAALLVVNTGSANVFDWWSNQTTGQHQLERACDSLGRAENDSLWRAASEHCSPK